jgi:hypothetical protein
MLNKKIADPKYRLVGRDDTDALIAAFRILWCDDVGGLLRHIMVTNDL